MNSQKKPIIVEEDFLNIGKQMLETNYILNLEQLLRIAPTLKKYLWQKLKPEKTPNVRRTTIDNKLVLEYQR